MPHKVKVINDYMDSCDRHELEKAVHLLTSTIVGC